MLYERIESPAAQVKSPYALILQALRLKEKSDRVIALREAWRACEDKEALFAAAVNIVADRGVGK
ncbi:hypothetical protein CGLAMM_02645 [Acetobacteraceae bacterium EV16G]|uniref:Uncharacterized protein n=1 Tax=Sorlinia euscelidii TaxID=3081148 RepID=A0ABU7U2I3_9PROT